LARVVLGIEALLADPPAWAATARVGLLTNQGAVDASFRPTDEQVAGLFGSRLKALFSPQHGFWSDKQDNMVESPDARHPLLKIRIFSLYGQTRQPTAEMLGGLDVLVVDLQDVGCRVYTYIQTLKLVVEACAEHGLKVVVLDRPNPLGRSIEGNLLEPSCFSFVGLFALPMRHGLTIGEMARLIKAEGADCELEVVAMCGYDPQAYFEATGLKWVIPSPNMPLVETAMVYPGQVLFEGTNISEGRGTTRPFEIFGAPFVDPYRLASRMAEYALEGVFFRPLYFEPTFNKHAGKLCGGLQIHVLDRTIFRPYRTSLALLQALAQLWPEETAFKDPPYEYEFERRPLDLILGRPDLADLVVSGRDLMELEEGWAGDLAEYDRSRQEYFLY